MEPRSQVLQALRTKACMKQDVFGRTTALFTELKEVVQEIAVDLKEQALLCDERLSVGYMDRGITSCELKVAGDVVVFSMHTNVFKLDRSHALWKTSYLEEDELRGYFGMVNMYNFLSDSMLYNRDRDLGYLVGRLFLNKDGHFFLQGKQRLGIHYNNLQESTMDRPQLKEMIYAMVNHVIDFDLLAPPYDQVAQLTVSDIKEMYANQQLSTGKRLGFRFSSDMDEPT